jgi:hypoxanthine phosphoribosyltransferase
VIIIEDIIDTGITTNFLLDYLNQQEPSSIRICALISKPSRRKVSININYLGFEVDDRFIVGYGLDWDENFRHLPELYSIEDE